jgi:hypothetical protein
MDLGDVALIAWRGHIEAAGEIVMRKNSPALARARNHGRYHLLRGIEPTLRALSEGNLAH